MTIFALDYSGVEIFVAGPPIEAGPLPGIFYFALSGEESLTLDPFNQAVAFLPKTPCRVYSLTIPGHEAGRDKTKAMGYWAEEFKAGRDPITPFIETIRTTIDALTANDLLSEGPIVASGLSRGAFIATHLAAADSRVTHVCGFSPLTQLTHHSDFQGTTSPLNLENRIGELHTTTVRFYIGNRDTRVGTDQCYAFIRGLTEAQYSSGKRSPSCELTIFPSIGHKGHGTPPEIFQAGAAWMAQQLRERVA